MSTPEELFRGYSTSAYDQIQAAVQANDWPLVARLGVEGYLRALEIENGDAEVSLELVVAAMLRLSHDNLVLWAAEALRRLHNERRPT